MIENKRKSLNSLYMSLEPRNKNKGIKYSLWGTVKLKWKFCDALLPCLTN